MFNKLLKMNSSLFPLHPTVVIDVSQTMVLLLLMCYVSKAFEKSNNFPRFFLILNASIIVVKKTTAFLIRYLFVSVFQRLFVRKF